MAADDLPPAPSSRTLQDYNFLVTASPLSEALRQSAYRCMCDVYAGDFETNGFGEEFLGRMAEAGDLYAVAMMGDDVVSHAMVSCTGAVGLLGGVATREAHRSRGLSRELTRRLVEQLYADGARSSPRWLILGTGSRTAAHIYSALGFRGINGSLEGAKGYNPNDEGEWIMLRDAEAPAKETCKLAGIADPDEPLAKKPKLQAALQTENVPFDIASYLLPGKVVVEPLARKHWGPAVLLLNASAGAMKMRAFGIDDGLTAELRLVQALRDREPVTVAVHEESQRVYGLAFCHPASGLEVYNIGPCSIAAQLAAEAAGGANASACPGSMSNPERSEFWERGYLVFPGLLSDEAPTAKRKMDELLRAGAGASTSNWNAVNSGSAEYVLQVDASGKPIPGKCLKVQAAALGSQAVLEVFRMPKICERIRNLYNFLGQEVPEHVDIFGTKFFPMWPGGTSVSWHQDCHYFGTGSPRIISCGIYLEDTDEENGCLQVVPGSHTRGIFKHTGGHGEFAQGEWVAPDSIEAVDVVVPSGSVVLFNAMLLHAARKNNHSSRTRYSLFGHYLPSSLNFSWRGTDFSHGVYQDRHTIY